MGLVPLVLSLLIVLGVITPDHQEQIKTGVNSVLDSAEMGIDAVLAVVSGAVGLIGIFSKDGDK